MSTQGNWLESFIIEKSKLIEYLISHDSHLFENEKIQWTCKNVWGMKRDRSTNQQLKTGKKHVDQEKRRN